MRPPLIFVPQANLVGSACFLAQGYFINNFSTPSG
jgi:hypothetical protein